MLRYFFLQRAAPWGCLPEEAKPFYKLYYHYGFLNSENF